jgi:hypothetical protein
LGAGGRFDVAAMVELLMLKQAAYSRFWLPFEREATSNHVPDLLTLRFNAANSSTPALRLLISTLYGAGFMLLAVPTLLTFAAILLRTFVGDSVQS